MGILEDLAAELGASPTELRASLLSQGEALQPTYLTIDIAGRVSANFSGHVHAQGLDLDVGAANPPGSQNSVRWLELDNTSAAFIGVGVGVIPPSPFTSERLVLQKQPSSGRVQHVDLIADSGVAGKTAEIDIWSDLTGVGTGQIDITAGALKKRLLSSDGSSDFLHGGNDVITWPGGSTTSNAKTVPHGAGRVPNTIVFGTRSSGPGAFQIFQFQAPDATNMFLQAVTIGGGIPGVGVQGTFDWAVS